MRGAGCRVRLPLDAVILRDKFVKDVWPMNQTLPAADGRAEAPAPCRIATLTLDDALRPTRRDVAYFPPAHVPSSFPVTTGYPLAFHPMYPSSIR